MTRRSPQQTHPSLDDWRTSGASFYRETPPPADLRDLVACMWVRVVRQQSDPGPSPIIPDGCGDLMAFDDAPPLVAGPDATTRWITIPDGTVITAARLRPGGVRTVFGCAATTILNRAVRLDDLVGGAAGLHQRLRSATGVRERYAALADWIRTAVHRTRTLDTTVRTACRWLAANPHADVGDVARQLGWNARGIRRHFHGACGYGPKHFQRVMRIQRAIREANVRAALTLADIAIAAGYADQAHMTRDFRDITGFTPARFLATSRPEYGVWMSEDWPPSVRNVQDVGAARS